MDKSQFQELLTAAGEALDHARDKRALRTTELPAAPQSMTAADIREMRDQVHASQAVFARYLNVSTKLVQAWESGRRTPDGPALTLLRLGGTHPMLVFGSQRRQYARVTRSAAIRSAAAGKRTARSTKRAKAIKKG